MQQRQCALLLKCCHVLVLFQQHNVAHGDACSSVKHEPASGYLGAMRQKD